MTTDDFLDAEALAYLIGQRPADVIGITEAQIIGGALVIAQEKTGAKVKIPVTGDLKAVIEEPHEFERCAKAIRARGEGK